MPRNQRNVTLTHGVLKNGAIAWETIQHGVHGLRGERAVQSVDPEHKREAVLA